MFHRCCGEPLQAHTPHLSCCSTCCTACVACPTQLHSFISVFLPQGALRFFQGHCAWGPGELERQIEQQGAWSPAACRWGLFGALLVGRAGQIAAGCGTVTVHAFGSPALDHNQTPPLPLPARPAAAPWC